MKSSDSSVLSLEAVTKLFGDKVAVNKLSLDVYTGEVFGFLGPNGAGKTTTIRLILDVLRPSAGKITLFNKDNRLTTTTHRRLGYLSGDMVIDGDLTGAQYLSFVDYQFGGGHEKRIKELANLLQINLKMRIDSYSRGNRQKIALIAALAHQPELLILDEPTSGFDPLVQETFMDLVNEYRAQGGTVFMSSHTLSEVQRLCNRVAFIKDGALVGIKDIDELKQSSTKTISISAKESEISSLKAGLNKLEGLKLRSSTKSVITLSYDGNISKLLQLLGTHHIDDITITEPELEEVFIGYYRNGGKA